MDVADQAVELGDDDRRGLVSAALAQLAGPLDRRRE
jgi:hypothetical protein